MMKDLYLQLTDNRTGESCNASLLEIAEDQNYLFQPTGELKDVDIKIIELDEPVEVLPNGLKQEEQVG